MSATAVAVAASPAMRHGRTVDVIERGERDDALRDLVEGAFWLTGVGALSLALTAGHPIGNLAGALTTIGRATGIVAASMMMVQLLVIARIPWIERRLGHDRAALLHGQLGRMGFLVMIAHVVTLVLGYAARSNDGWWNQSWAFLTDYGTEMTLSVIGFWLLIAIVLTSLAAVRAKWKYEKWHAVHLLTYLTVAFSIPHQFVNGTTFSGSANAATDTFARWYWALLWTVSVGGFLVYRIGRPLVSAARYRLTVAHVERNSDGTVSVWVRGRGLSRMNVKAGQFFEWRFLAPGLWTQGHPYSLSMAPQGDLMRITVKIVGDGTAALLDLLPGTPVMVEGPLGRFTLENRRAHGTILAGAGSGIAPVVAMLRDIPGDAPIVVMLRAHTADEIPHLDEVRELADAKGATLYLLTGKRGRGWFPEGLSARLAQVVPHLAAYDIYVCGPQQWSRALLDDARASGVPAEQLHVEEFVW